MTWAEMWSLAGHSLDSLSPEPTQRIKVGNAVQFREGNNGKWLAAMVTEIDTHSWAALIVFPPLAPPYACGPIEKNSAAGRAWREIE